MTQQTRTIAESNNFIVLDKYVTEWEASDRYQSESELEHELIQDLRNQGYEFVPDLTSQSAMLANVRVQLQALNQVVFSEGEWRRFTELRVISITPVILLSIKPVRFMITTFVISLLMMVVLKISVLSIRKILSVISCRLSSNLNRRERMRIAMM